MDKIKSIIIKTISRMDEEENKTKTGIMWGGVMCGVGGIVGLVCGEVEGDVVKVVIGGVLLVACSGFHLAWVWGEWNKGM